MQIFSKEYPWQTSKEIGESSFVLIFVPQSTSPNFPPSINSKKNSAIYVVWFCTTGQLTDPPATDSGISIFQTIRYRYLPQYKPVMSNFMWLMRLSTMIFLKKMTRIPSDHDTHGLNSHVSNQSFDCHHLIFKSEPFANKWFCLF